MATVTHNRSARTDGFTRFERDHQTKTRGAQFPDRAGPNPLVELIPNTTTYPSGPTMIQPLPGQTIPAHFNWWVRKPQHTGSGATATATINAEGGVDLILPGDAGSDYSVPPPVRFSGGGGGSGASATAILTGGGVTGFTDIVRGSGYTEPPIVTLVDPRRDYLTVADWQPHNYHEQARMRADLMLAHVENVRHKILADEFHHQTPAEKRHNFTVVSFELTEELVTRADVHAAINAVAAGKPIFEGEIQTIIAAARNKPLAFLSVTKSGSLGATRGTIIGHAPPGAKVRWRAKNLNDVTRRSGWSGWTTVPEGRNVWSFADFSVGNLGSARGQRIEIEIQQEGVSTTVKTKTGEHIVIS